MIGQLSGKILTKNPPEIVLEVNHIGYEILCPVSTFYAIGNETNLTLYTHLQIKEDAHTLYGFISQHEKILFRELIRVNGVGPKVALSILSHLDVASLANAIAVEDDALIAKTPGIGKKTAQKLIVELKDRLAKTNLSSQNPKITTNPNSEKAASALQGLGFKAKEAAKMLSAINDSTLSTEQLVRLALQNK